MTLISFDVFRTLGFPDTRVIKPEQFLVHREALQTADWVLFPDYWQLNALVYGLKCRIFPSLSSYTIGHDKVEMTRAFETVAPAHLPWTLIRANGPLEQEEIWQTLPLPFVAKNPKASMGEGVWQIENRQDWLRYCGQTQVLYAQELLPMDRDLRIVVVGGNIIAAYWRQQSPYGFHNNLARGGTLAFDPVPASACALALQVARDLDINHAGFDIAMVDGHPYLLEFNRLFGNQGVDSKALRQAILATLGMQPNPDFPTGPPAWPLAG
ncbi:MAG: hypothetical protein EA349_08940 [Halomonadaceae bacterium]|nr:MAG: hypothetical protein EA349_08940 [Halomonadaceae bacterium]